MSDEAPAPKYFLLDGAPLTGYLYIDNYDGPTLKRNRDKSMYLSTSTGPQIVTPKLSWVIVREDGSAYVADRDTVNEYTPNDPVS